MATQNKCTRELITQQGILPLFYHDDWEVTIKVVNALYAAGIRIVEYTNGGKNTLINFSYLLACRNTQWPGLKIGIGTVKSAEQAKVFIKSGADFIICPGVIGSVAKTVHASGLLWIPGCMTVTEIILAEHYGASIVKIFPGKLLGPSFINSIKDIFPDLLFMPTGGVEINKESMGAWFESGVCAVGLGSQLINSDLMLNRNYGLIQSGAQLALQITAVYKTRL